MDTLHDAHTICNKQGYEICIMLERLLLMQEQEENDDIVNELITPMIWELIEQMEPIEE